MQPTKRPLRRKKSIFRALFVPLFLIMVLQAGIFYLTAVYGGVADTLHKNAAAILTERLTNRKNELETDFDNHWTNLENCEGALASAYTVCETRYGSQPLVGNKDRQVEFLSDAAPYLIGALRRSEANGAFLILNNDEARQAAPGRSAQQLYGLCIRDMDQKSSYLGKEDLLLERAPSSLIEPIGITLDAWWEAKYAFHSAEEGDYFYQPLNAAWDHPGVQGKNLGYLSGAHRLSAASQEVVSYSVPLVSAEGYPYGVLGVELTTGYLASLLPENELSPGDTGCYVLALTDPETGEYTPLATSGVLYDRCFGGGATDLQAAAPDGDGGFTITGQEGTALYGSTAEIKIYSNNNPFAGRRLTLLALVESDTLFAYVGKAKELLQIASLLSLTLGVLGIVAVSRSFAQPITALARRVRGMRPDAEDKFTLGRLGINEIDQLVDSIETLSHDVGTNMARTEFFSRMSHDMRTPMNAIIGFSSPELLEEADEARKDEYLSKIHSSGSYLLGLINEVLDITKIESGKAKLHNEPARAAALWQTTLPIIGRLARQKNITFEQSLRLPPETWVLADVQHLNQIAINLLSNAVKFTPEGGRVRLEITETPAATPDKLNICLRVQDNGIGMSKEFLQLLYTPFEQENVGREGTGLGLSISKKLVEMMGGSICCHSRKQVGTLFVVELALETCAAPRALRTGADQDTAAPQSPPPASLRGLRVLICEDQPLNAQILCRLLEHAGVATDTTADGRQGLEAFTAAPPDTYDAILMDIRMPVMDGLAATRAIRGLARADAASIPIIAMTANAFAEDQQATAAAGMNAHLSKPVDPALLYDTLARLTAGTAENR